jgi:anti-sigma B factor antagonist
MSPTQPSHSDPPPNAIAASEKLASVSRRERDGLIIAAIQGEIDISNATEIGRELTNMSNRALGLVVDLTEVDHLDSSGIALLYDLQVRLARRDQRLVVVAPINSAARRVLELTAFDKRATIEEDVDSATSAARSSVGNDEELQDDLT